MKWRYRVLIGIGVVCTLMMGGVAVLFETGPGLHWAIARVESMSGGAVKIGAVHGRLAGPFTLEDLRVTLPNVVIEAKRTRIDWQPLALLAGRLHVTSLHGFRVRIAMRPSHAPSRGLPRKLDLPLRIVIDEARLTQLTLRGPKDSVRLERLAFALHADDNRVALDKLEAHGPLVALDGRLQVRPHGNWPVDTSLSVLLRPRGYPALSGHTRLTGNLRGALQLIQTLDTPFRARLATRITGLLTKPSVRGTLRIARLDPHVIHSTWPVLNAGAHLAFAGEEQHFTVRGDLAARGRTVRLDFAGGLEDKRIRIRHLNLSLADTPTRFTVRGVVHAVAPHVTDITLAWQRLFWPLRGASRVTAATGAAHITGTLDRWTLTLRTLLRVRNLPRGRWTLKAHGTPRQLELTALVGQWLGGVITARGRLLLTIGRPFNLNARVRGLQLQTIDPDTRGHFGFDLAAGGRLTPLQARAQISNARGQMRGHPVTGQASLAYTANTLTIHKLALDAGPNRLRAEGRWGAEVDLNWQLRAPELKLLARDLGGRLDAEGSLTGLQETPRIEATLQGDNLHWKNLSIAKAQARATIDLNGHAASNIALHLQHLERGGMLMQRLDATLLGPAQAQRFRIALHSNRGNVTLVGTGRWSGRLWTGLLATADLSPTRGSTFRLAGPAELTLATHRIALGRSCWRDSDRARFCLAAASGSNGWTADLTWQAIPLDLADPYFANDLALKGALNGYLTAKGGNGNLQALGEIHAGRGEISHGNGRTERHLGFDEAGLLVRLDKNNLDARLGMILADGGMLDAKGEIPWRSSRQLAGNLHLRAYVPNLSGFAALSTAIADVRGRLNADLRISGSVDAPRFAGDLDLTRVAFTLTRFGTRIENGDLTVHGMGPGLAIDGTLHDAGKGRLTVHGALRQTNRQWTLKAHIGGKDFLAADMPEAQVAVSPDLDIGVAGRAIKLDGSVTVPSAKIRPPHFSNAIAPTPDLVVVGEKQSQAGPPWQLTTQLRIHLGDDVHFKGYGLTAQVGGELTIHDSPGKLTTASGELKILNGKYKAYGQDLTIQHGRLLFSGGPIANPGLDIRAARTAGLVTAGLQITGTLNNPRLRVFSDPPMSQSDALAYLLFGHGMQQATGSQQSTIDRAANAIGVAGGTYLAKTIGQHVGIQTVSVENANPYSASANQASLFLGRYLSPRLYVSYGIGLYAPINLLRIRYTLSRHWALEAESGTFSGADILFNINR